ncbi:MAG: hypothetical protein ACI8R4_003662, partial [Paracoccaceae bacterium]
MIGSQGFTRIIGFPVSAQALNRSAIGALVAGVALNRD